MRIGITEFILIIVVALALIKPEKLKEYAAMLGKAIRKISDEKEEISKQIAEPLKDVASAVSEVNNAVNDVKEIAQDLKSPISNECKVDLKKKDREDN